MVKEFARNIQRKLLPCKTEGKVADPANTNNYMDVCYSYLLKGGKKKGGGRGGEEIDTASATIK